MPAVSSAAPTSFRAYHPPRFGLPESGQQFPESLVILGRNMQYLALMTFQGNERPLFAEIFGPIIGLKEEWEEQGASPEELNFSAFVYRCESRG